MYKRWTEGGPAGALHGVDESGWMDASVFLSWFTKLFLRAVCPPDRKRTSPLFLDGHHSHVSLELIRTAHDNNVMLLCLPPNMTHLLQPLDVGVFGPIKNAWRSIIKRHKLESRGERVSKEVFPSLLAQLWDISFKPDHYKGGFHGTGLVPFSWEHVLKKITPPDTAVSSKDAISTNSDIHTTTDQSRSHN